MAQPSKIHIGEMKLKYCVRADRTLNPMILSSLRVGRENAKTRQDIVLSGHFIKDEHCTFSSTTSPQGEGDGCCFYTAQKIIIKLIDQLYLTFFFTNQDVSFLSHVRGQRRTSTASG